MFRTFCLFIVGFVLSFHLFADTLSQKSPIMQAIKQCPQVVRYVEKDKIYIDSQYLSFRDQQLILTTPLTTVAVDEIKSDSTGSYLCFAGDDDIQYYYECLNCTNEWKANWSYSRCPRCGSEKIVLRMMP